MTQKAPEQPIHSQALNLLRFPLAIVIVTVHIFEYQPNGYNAAEFPIFDFIKSFIEAFLHWQSTPIYYFISGFVFYIGLRNWDKNKWIKKIKNRKNSLLIPFLIWNTFYLFLLLTIKDMSFQELDFKSILTCYWRYDGALTGVAPTGMPINYPLWFLRDLMVTVLFTPLMYKLIKKNGKTVLSILAVLWLIKYFGVIKFYIPAQAFFFFYFGAYMSINGKDMIAEFGKHSKFTTLGFIVLGVLSMYFYNSNPAIFKALKALSILFGLFFAFNTAVWLLKKGYCKVNKFLSSTSFFIFVSHALVYPVVFKALKLLLMPSSDICWLIVFLTTAAATSLILVTVFYLMSRFTPKILDFITGRKG